MRHLIRHVQNDYQCLDPIQWIWHTKSECFTYLVITAIQSSESSVSVPKTHKPHLSPHHLHIHTPLLPHPVPVHRCDVWQLESVAFHQLRRPVRTRPTYHHYTSPPRIYRDKGIRDGSANLPCSFPCLQVYAVQQFECWMCWDCMIKEGILI
jgi:hypothetical protein